MSSDWPEVRLGDHVESCLGKMLDAKKNKGVPQPYLGNSNVRWGNFEQVDLAEMKFEPHEEERYGLIHGDLVVCEGGEPGRCAIWIGSKGMKIQKALHRIRPKSTFNNYYLYYWFCHAAKSGLLERYFTGTTIKHLTGKAIASLDVPRPPGNVQVQMVKVLRSLDDTIRNLRDQNIALESIAQTLFRSWFVDFDPVHAKASGTVPEAVSAELAALFPSEFEASELGLIPKEWGVTSFGNAFDIKGGGTPSTKEASYWDNGTHSWATPKDMSNLTSKVIYQTAFKLTTEGVNKISSKVLPAGTTLMSSRAPVGYLAIAKAPISINQGFIAIPPTEGLPPSFILNLLLNKMPEIKANAGGTTFAEISKSQFRPIKWVRPSKKVIKAFGRIAEPLYASVHANCLTIDALAALRDHLLPRLISGKLRIEDAEASLAELTSGLEAEPA
jgi:type I restriction enzyme S subunit